MMVHRSLSVKFFLRQSIQCYEQITLKQQWECIKMYTLPGARDHAR